jgi:hypothetical protein
MRTKLNKKLMLNKETISDLNHVEMGFVKGGNLWETYTEQTVGPDCTEPGGTGTGYPTVSCPTSDDICG